MKRSAGVEVMHNRPADLLQGGGGCITLPNQPYRRVSGITYYDMQWARQLLRGGVGAVATAGCWAEEEVAPRGMVADLINKMWHNIFFRQWLPSRRATAQYWWRWLLLLLPPRLLLFHLHDSCCGCCCSCLSCKMWLEEVLILY